MFGAICGDIIGSYYETHRTKNYDFSLFNSASCFTDDTVLTVAVCDTLLYNSELSRVTQLNKRAAEYAYHYKQYCHRYPISNYPYAALEELLTKSLASYYSSKAMAFPLHTFS